MSRVLIVAGLAIVVVGVLWPWIGRFPWGKLPGDILIQRENSTIFIPLGTCLLIGGVLTLLFWLFRR